MKENEHSAILLKKAIELTNTLDTKALVVIGIQPKSLPKMEIPVVIIGNEAEKKPANFHYLQLPLSLGTKNLINLASRTKPRRKRR